MNWQSFSRFSAAVLAAGGLWLPVAVAGNAEPAMAWPQWRGPEANGFSANARPPMEWSEQRNVRWKVALPGSGHSSPIVLGDLVIVTGATPVGEAQPPVHDRAPGVHDSVPVTHRHQYAVQALSRRDGRTVWRTVVHEAWPNEGGHTTGSPASNSPVTDGVNVYASFGSQGVYCLGADGQVKWRRDLGRMRTLHAHGEGSSPVVVGDLLIVNWDHEGDSYLYAFDRKTGDQRWKVARDEPTSWSTPLVVQAGGREQVVVSATRRIRGYDPSNGAVIWECAGLSDNVVASPVAFRGLVIAGHSYYTQAMLAIRLEDARGDLTGSTNVVWRLNRMTPYVPSPLLYGDSLYHLRHNQNVLVRLDPATGRFPGEPLRLEAIRDFIFSSPVGADGRIYVTGRDGTTVVLRHDRDNAVLAVNRLDDRFSASMALVDREILLRGERSLYCLAEP